MREATEGKVNVVSILADHFNLYEIVSLRFVQVSKYRTTMLRKKLLVTEMEEVKAQDKIVRL